MATSEDTLVDKAGPGGKPMSARWTAFLIIYLLLFLGFILWILVSLWPPVRPDDVRRRMVEDVKASSPTPTPTPTPTPPPPPAARSATATPTPTPTPTPPPSPNAASASPPPPSNAVVSQCEASRIKDGFCLDDKGLPREGVGAGKIYGFDRCFCIYDEDRLLLIVLLAGALGALVHAFRSLSWYIGNRQLFWSWSAMYFMLPFLGAGLAMIFYLLIRGGFFSPTSTVADTSPFGFAALAALIGMFTEPAVIKLRKVAVNLLEPPEKGKDHVPPEGPKNGGPTITSLSDTTGPAAGGQTVTITGTKFSAKGPVSVMFGEATAEVTEVTETKVVVTTPQRAAGQVDVTVVNPDNTKAVLTGGYTFE